MNEQMPTTHTLVTLTELPGNRTRMLMEARFPSSEAMEQMIAMGMEEGLASAMGQIDAILTEG